jgi:protein arginine N-methyltransferase 2
VFLLHFFKPKNLELHHEMLSDAPRTEAYHSVINAAAPYFSSCVPTLQLGRHNNNPGSTRGPKTVLDVGCGTGVLAMFAAKAGAHRVFAVEGGLIWAPGAFIRCSTPQGPAASDLAATAAGLVQDNGLGDVVTVLHSRAEEAVLPGPVDVIVSEWMGTMLVFEYMIETVLHARDRWLRPGGTLWPSRAALFLCPCDAALAHSTVGAFGRWSDVYGLDFARLAPAASAAFSARPVHDYELSPDELLASPAAAAAPVFQMDLHTVTVADLEVIAGTFACTVSRAGQLNALGSWWDVAFDDPERSEPHHAHTLSTGPAAPQTHWKQDLLLLPAALPVAAGDVVTGSLRLVRHPALRRHMRVQVHVEVRDAAGASCAPPLDHTYALWR